MEIRIKTSNIHLANFLRLVDPFQGDWAQALFESALAARKAVR